MSCKSCLCIVLIDNDFALIGNDFAPVSISFFLYPCSPSGWDTEKKIAILHESMKSFSFDKEYEEVIIAPKSTQVRPQMLFSNKLTSK